MKWRWSVKIVFFLIFLIGILGAVSAQITVEDEALENSVVIDGKTLFTIKNRAGLLLPSERARIIQERVLRVAEDWHIPVEDIQFSDNDDGKIVEIIAGQMIVMTVSVSDAQTEDMPLEVLSDQWLQAIKTAVYNYRENRTLHKLVLQFFKAVLLTAAMVWFFSLLRKLVGYCQNSLQNENTLRLCLKKFPFAKWLPIEQLKQLFFYVIRICSGLVKLILAYFYLSVVLGWFPWTAPYSHRLFRYIAALVQPVAYAIWDYMPNALTIAVILVVTQLILRVVRFIFTLIKQEKIRISGFYPEWADSTYKIVRFFILAILVISIFPYLPGSQSMAFQGVSVFMGVLLSFGSSAAMANVVAGIALTYTRSFKIGDRVKIGEHIGDILDKSLLVTKIRTVKNEDITIPNSVILNNPIMNYTSSSNETALILHTEVTVGYDVPWQTVHRLLVEAALATPDILAHPSPFVIQRRLNDTTVSYEINAYTKKPNRMAIHYSGLYRNIIDLFQAEGIDMMTPNYIAFHGETKPPEKIEPVDGQ